MKWISVKDAMPERETMESGTPHPWSDVVMVAVKREPDDWRKEPYNIQFTQWNFHNSCWCDLEGGLLLDAPYHGEVTHWMPLPAPPTESSDGTKP